MNISPNSCDVDEGSSFSQALTDAKNNAGPDTIRLGSAPITTPTGFSYIGPDPVAIVGAGGRAFGHSRTSISDSSASPAGHVVLTVTGAPGSTISGIDIVVPTGPNAGIDTNGTISDVAVEAANPTSGGPSGVLLEAGGALSASDVSLPTNLLGVVGVAMVGSNTLVDASTIRAAHAIQTSTGAGGVALSGTVRRSEIVSSVGAIEIDGGNFLIEDSLLRNATDNVGGHEGIGVGAINSDSTVAVDHVTMLGSSGSSPALRVQPSGSHSASLSFRNSVFTQYGATFSRIASGAQTANISTDYSSYSGAPANDSGPGAITETNHLSADPGFLSATDFHLRSDSPLIDAGDPAALGSGESAIDLSGQPRITDANGDCTARRDVGAYEFQPGPRAPHAAATVSPSGLVVGTVATFDASASCDPDGDALTYAWTFDDGATVTGATVSHSFATSGTHFGSVTVTDSTGRAATATASAFVAEPSPPPPPVKFLGVKIAKQTVRVSRRGVASVKVKCPASTAAGPCAGRLTLVGRKGSFTVATGKTKKVAVKLSKATLKSLRKKGRLKTTATAQAHDAAGASKTTHGKVTLLTPR